MVKPSEGSIVDTGIPPITGIPEKDSGDRRRLMMKALKTV